MLLKYYTLKAKVSRLKHLVNLQHDLHQKVNKLGSMYKLDSNFNVFVRNFEYFT